MMSVKHTLYTFVVIANAANLALAQADSFDQPDYPEGEETIQESGEAGAQHYQDMLLVSWVPYPVDQWDYVILNISDPEYVKESGRAPLASFKTSNYPDVTLVMACTPKDRDYFYNYDLDVPIIGVDPFQKDHIFLEYLDRIYTIHEFQNPTELWAHLIGHPSAFSPVIGRLSQEFQTYLDNWKPRGQNGGYSEYTPSERKTRARLDDHRN